MLKCLNTFNSVDATHTQYKHSRTHLNDLSLALTHAFMHATSKRNAHTIYSEMPIFEICTHRCERKRENIYEMVCEWQQHNDVYSHEQTFEKFHFNLVYTFNYGRYPEHRIKCVAISFTLNEFFAFFLFATRIIRKFHAFNRFCWWSPISMGMLIILNGGLV